jgi:hypothetical protein
MALSVRGEALYQCLRLRFFCLAAVLAIACKNKCARSPLAGDPPIETNTATLTIDRKQPLQTKITLKGNDLPDTFDFY